MVTRHGQLQFVFPIVDRESGIVSTSTIRVGGAGSVAQFSSHEMIASLVSADTKRYIARNWRIEPQVDFNEESVHLAAYLAAVTDARRIRNGVGFWQGPIWATGAINPDGGRIRQDMDVAEAQSKLATFLSPSTDSQLLIIPAAVAGKTGSRHDVLSIDDFLQCARRKAFWESGRKTVLAVQEAYASVVADAIVGASFVKPMSVRLPRSWLAGLIVATTTVAIGSYRWFGSPPCVPMDWQCFKTGSPAFEPSELGFLIEQRSFGPSSDTSQMVKALAGRFTDWRNEFGAATCSADASMESPELARVRVVAIPHVTEDAVRRSRAGLGIAGQLEYSGSPGEYYFHDARAILNVAALTSFPNSSEFSTRTFQRTARLRGMIDYAGEDITFSGGLTNAMRGATLPKGARKPFFVLRGTLSANGQGLQNLNWSRGTELSLLERQSSIEYIPNIIDVVSSTSLKPYAISLLKLRLVANDWLNRWTVHTDLHQTFAESPPIFRSLAHQLLGEGILFTIHGYYNEATQSPLCAQSIDPEHVSREAVYEWAAPIVEHYTAAASLRRCVSCRLTLAKLRNCAGDEDEVLNILDSTAREVRGPDAARLVHEAIKYAESTIARAANPPNQSARLAPKIRRWLDVLRETSHGAIADFEHGRWLLAWGNPDEAKERLAQVLTKRPAHLFTRFLYTKALGASEGIPGAERVQILMSILEDLLRLQTDPTKDEDFHSLGPIDDVQYSINPTYVVEDLISAQVARCDPSVIRTAQRARLLSHVDCGEIANAFQSDVRGYYAFPGIARWSSQSSLRCDDLQMKTRHLFETFTRAGNR